MTIILDPTDERVPVVRQISERKGTVQGVVGLLNISKPRGNILLDELDRLLTDAAPDVKIRRYTKPTFAKPCPDALRHQIRDDCDFLIEGLAD